MPQLKLTYFPAPGKKIITLYSLIQTSLFSSNDCYKTTFILSTASTLSSICVGRAESIRLVLTFAGIDFEDERISFDELSKRKPSLPYGSLPVMEIDGTIYSQSRALLHYVGRLAKLYPENDALKALKIDQIMDGFEGKDYSKAFVWARNDVLTLNCLTDIRQPLVSTFRMPEKEKLTARAEIAKNIFPRYLAGVEKLIEGNGYTVGSELTLSDFGLYTFVRS